MAKKFTEFSDLCAFGLETIEASIDLVHKMGPSGVEVVAGREGEYRYWDPETLKVDRDCEDLFIERIKRKELNCRFLSEECGQFLRTGFEFELFAAKRIFFLSRFALAEVSVKILFLGTFVFEEVELLDHRWRAERRVSFRYS